MPEYNNVGFHEHYDRRDASTRISCVNTVYAIRSSNMAMAKPTLHLVERWINIPYSRGMIHFFHPGLVASCARGDESAGSVFACEPIDKTALDLGIITSLDIVHSADQNSENCDPPCGAPVPVCCRLSIPVLRGSRHLGSSIGSPP